MPFVDQLLLDAKTATTTVFPVYDFKGCLQVTFYVRSNGTTSGGTLVLETALTKDYAGTWAPLATTINASASSADKTLITQVLGPLRWVRARIATTITGGGTLSVEAVGY